MIRSTGFTLAVLLLLGAGVVAAEEQGKARCLTAVGAVTWVGGTSFTVDTGKRDVEFAVGPTTNVLARGASSKARAKKDAGEGGLTMADVVHVGDQVVVKYNWAGGGFQASEIDVKYQRPVVTARIR